MNLNARLTKLEATHKKILRCVFCRFSLRDIPPSRRPQYTDSGDFLLVKCWTCGSRYFISLEGKSERQREIKKFIYTSHPTKAYNDERVHAAILWWVLSASQVKKYRLDKQRRRADAESRKHGVSPAQRDYRSPRDMTATQRKAEREKEALSKQAIEFHRKERERWKRLARGPESFPIDETLRKIEARYKLENYGEQIKEYVRQAGLPVDDNQYSEALNNFKVASVVFHHHLSVLKKREACEVVLWGQAEANTLEEIAFFETRLKRLPDIARRALAKEEEEKRRREEERKREREEYLARTRPAQPEPAKVLSESVESSRRPHGQRSFEMVAMPSASEGKTGHYWADPPEEAKSQPPRDDGSDPYYRYRMAYYKQYGIWASDKMLFG